MELLRSREHPSQALRSSPMSQDIKSIRPAPRQFVLKFSAPPYGNTTPCFLLPPMEGMPRSAWRVCHTPGLGKRRPGTVSWWSREDGTTTHTSALLTAFGASASATAPGVFAGLGCGPLLRIRRRHPPDALFRSSFPLAGYKDLHAALAGLEPATLAFQQTLTAPCSSQLSYKAMY